MPNVPLEPKKNAASRVSAKKSKGAAANPKDTNGYESKRPIEEEDVFGGAERTHNTNVASKKAKP